MDLEKARRLMGEALEESALGVGEALARLAERKTLGDAARAELESERFAWREERAAFQEAVRSLKDRLAALREESRRQSELVQAMILELQEEKASWEAERLSRERRLSEESAALRQREAELAVKMRALEDHHRAQMAELRRQTERLLDDLRGHSNR